MTGTIAPAGVSGLVLHLMPLAVGILLAYAYVFEIRPFATARASARELAREREARRLRGGALCSALSLVCVAAAAMPASATATVAGDRCAATYTRAHFHAAARSTFATAFPAERKKRTLAKVVRCQRRAVSVRIVRVHRKRYRAAWTGRFFFVRAWARVPAWVKAHLDSIRWCESRDDYRAIGGGGAYRGAYQFSFSTWTTVGGAGDPAAAPEREQDVRAAWLLMRDGSGHWPVCQ